jgi:hypothetical protein
VPANGSAELPQQEHPIHGIGCAKQHQGSFPSHSSPSKCRTVSLTSFLVVLASLIQSSMTMEACAEALRVILAFWPLSKEYVEYADVRRSLCAILSRCLVYLGLTLPRCNRCCKRVSLHVSPVRHKKRARLEPSASGCSRVTIVIECSIKLLR